MNLIRIKSLSLLLFLAVLVLGFLLRFHNFTTWPREGATFDEFAWTWLGVNLIQEKTPISWSSHPQYENRKHIIYRGAAFFLVKPYLEHPPFFGLVAGGFAILNGANNMYDVDLPTIRPLALIMGLISIVLIYILVKEIYDHKYALIASLLYATIPTVVIGSRIVQNENFFIPMWLVSLALIQKFLKTKKSLYRNIAAILCGILILSKAPWIAAPISIGLIFLYFKKYKDFFKFSFLVIPIGLLYLAYGFLWDTKVFLELWSLQLNRYDISFVSIYALFQKPFLVDRFYLDGWIYFGWFSFLFLLLKDFKKNFMIILPILSYFLIFLAGVPDEAGHGWYRYPFYPFLVISIAIFLKEYFNKNYILTFLFLVFVGTSLLQNTWATVFGFSYLIFRIVIISWGVILFPLFYKTKLTMKVSKFMGVTWFTSLILLNIWSILLYNEQ